MNQLAAEYQALANYKPQHKVRFVTAASLFDGHDAAINIMRRILQSMGAEVIHLGHNRSVDDVVTAALQEDVQGIAISSYQGGHVEYFKYMVDMLREKGAVSHSSFWRRRRRHCAQRNSRAASLRRDTHLQPGRRPAHGPARHDWRHGDALRPVDLTAHAPADLNAIARHSEQAIGVRFPSCITALEAGQARTLAPSHAPTVRSNSVCRCWALPAPVERAKAVSTDELIRRLRLDQDDALRVAVVSIDPSRRKSGGALLGDRIRMNAIGPWQHGQRVFMRSVGHARLWQRNQRKALPDAIAACQCAGFDLVVVETSGIGQGDAAIVPHVGYSVVRHDTRVWRRQPT
jgi:methylmalonyl-CoA mutase